MIKACYIHIPFCKYICSYCDFPKIYYNSSIVKSYLEALDKEITTKYKGEVLDTIYIGGGTPSCFSLEELESLFHILGKLNKSSDCEFTIEINFDSITKAKLDLFKRYGVNRLSFGLETINKKHIEFLGRENDIDHIKDMISYSKSIGLNNINIDLIYAIKNQTIEELNTDIDFILDLDIKHISTYSLIIEDNTILKINNTSNISEDLDLLMYNNIISRLKDNGFIHYEISNFAKERYCSKHNLVYWNNDYYYGFGMGAASYIPGKRLINTRSINKYIAGDYLFEEEKIFLEDNIIYEVILGFRLCLGLDKNKFKDKFGVSIDNIFNYNSLIEDGFLIEDDTNIYISEDKLYISNKIIEEFLDGKR